MQKFNDKAQSSIIGGTLLLLETCVQILKRIYEREIDKWLAFDNVVLELMVMVYAMEAATKTLMQVHLSL